MRTWLESRGRTSVSAMSVLLPGSERLAKLCPPAVRLSTTIRGTEKRRPARGPALAETLPAGGENLFDPAERVGDRADAGRRGEREQRSLADLVGRRAGVESAAAMGLEG